MRCSRLIPTAATRCSPIASRSSVNAVHEPWNRRPRALAHADRIAEAVGLDVAAAGWSPTVDNYFGRVTKARIVQAVREAKGEQCRSAHRTSEEGRDGGEGARAARWLGLAARAAAHARSGNQCNGSDGRNQLRLHRQRLLERNWRRPDTKRPWPRLPRPAEDELSRSRVSASRG